MNLVCFSPEVRGFVSKLAMLSCILMYAVRHSSLAHPSLTKWYAMALDFFFSVEAGAVVFARMDWLSPKIKSGSSTVIPIIHNLKPRPWTYSVACFMATNWLPKVLVSQEPCFLELQYIGALLRKTINPIQEHWLTKSPAWLLSAYTLILIVGPCGVGMLGGISSSSPAYLYGVIGHSIGGKVIPVKMAQLTESQLLE